VAYFTFARQLLAVPGVVAVLVVHDVPVMPAATVDPAVSDGLQCPCCCVLSNVHDGSDTVCLLLLAFLLAADRNPDVVAGIPTYWFNEQLCPSMKRHLKKK
jgi:hypothetical protein